MIWWKLRAWLTFTFAIFCPRCGRPFTGRQPHGLNLFFESPTPDDKQGVKCYRIVCGRCAADTVTYTPEPKHIV